MFVHAFGYLLLYNNLLIELKKTKKKCKIGTKKQTKISRVWISSEISWSAPSPMGDCGVKNTERRREDLKPERAEDRKSVTDGEGMERERVR